MKKKLLALTLAITFVFTGCGAAKDGSGNQGVKTEKEPFVAETIAEFEAETATLSGNTKIDTSLSGYSGEGYISGFEQDTDEASVEITVPAEDFYDLEFIVASSGGYKENYLYVDGEMIGNITGENAEFEPFVMKHIYLTEGTHTVTLQKYWGWVNWDKVNVLSSEPFDTGIYEVSAKLVNPDASDNAKRLMSYLCDNYGTNVISGQYCQDGAFGQEMAVIWKETGVFPAMVGLDMIEYSPSRAANGSVGTSIERALEAWDAGIPVTMCWHWNAPEKYLTGEWYSGFYKEEVNIDLDKIMDGTDTEGYELLMSDMEVIANELKVLHEADVPVLWRPLHEASGGWFWWGDCSAESYIELYRLMYDKFTNEYGLNNLIWVWNGQDPTWYPGDDVVDIVGEDIYPGYQVYTSQYATYMEGYDSTETAKKMVVLSENGCLMDPDLMIRDGAMWGYFGTWSGEFVTNSGTLNIYAETYTDAEMLKKVYTHENVITRDELPDLKSYPIREDAD